MKSFLLLCFIIFLTLSCESDNEVEVLSLEGCASGILTELSDVEASLVGEWVITDARCGQCGEPEPNLDSVTVFVSFKADKTFSILFDDTVNSTGEWSVEQFETFAQINVTPTTIYLTDSFTMCETELLTNDRTVVDLLQVKYRKLR